MFAVVLFIILKIGIKTNFPSLEERINKPLFSPTMGCYTEDNNGCTGTIWITICKFQEPELSDKGKVAKVKTPVKVWAVFKKPSRVKVVLSRNANMCILI